MDHKILIIDAHPVFIYKMEGFFKGLTFQNVFLANSGHTGLNMVQAHRPDLVLLSGMLPDMLSRAVCQTIKEISPSTKVIVQVGLFTEEKTIDNLIAGGADAVIARKEKDLAPLQKAVEDLLEIPA